jgi:hypothetical protein
MSWARGVPDTLALALAAAGQPSGNGDRGRLTRLATADPPRHQDTNRTFAED